MDIDNKFWDLRYEEGQPGWDIGCISTPLKEYFDQLNDKNIEILIPGAGNAYEAEYLHNKGFENVYVIDWSKKGVESFLLRYPDFPKENIFIENFFEHKGKYDLVIEQTFFCAISPSERKHYSEKVFELLKPGGKLVGLLFDDPLNPDKPPFGGNREEYIKYFKPYFKFKVYETAYNSIKPREGREIFINLVKM
jgi:methyl halide transferase